MSGDTRTPEELVEQGVGLIAQGMFRAGHSTSGNDPRAASELGLSAVSVIREMALDFLKRANAQQSK